MKRTWIKVKRGLLEPKHREKIGIRVWLYVYMLDLVDWKTGMIPNWTDKEAAAALDMPWRTVQRQRQQLAIDGYINCVQAYQSTDIFIRNWTNPREYSGDVINKGTQPVRTPIKQGTQLCVPIHTQSCVPSHIDHIKTTYKVDVPAILRTPEVMGAWVDWETHRKEIRKKLTPPSVKRQFALLEKHAAQAVEIIEVSIMNSYQGLFPPKAQTTRRNGRPQERPQIEPVEVYD